MAGAAVLGIEKKITATLISLIGVVQCVARIVYSWIADLDCTGRAFMFAMGHFATGTVTALSALATDTITAGIFILAYALLTGKM